jgi:hypothetical protein
MSNISGTPVFTGFIGSSRTFKTSAFNHSAISPEENPASVLIAGIPSEVNAQMGFWWAWWGVLRRFWWIGTVFGFDRGNVNADMRKDVRGNLEGKCSYTMHRCIEKGLSADVG